MYLKEKLKNGDHVHKDLFGHFLFFNIASSESRSGHSLFNQDEATFRVKVHMYTVPAGARPAR